MMQNLKKLKWLGLQQNQINSVDTNCIKCLVSLEYLDLSCNQIGLLNSDDFSELINIKNIRV